MISNGALKRCFQFIGYGALDSSLWFLGLEQAPLPPRKERGTSQLETGIF